MRYITLVLVASGLAQEGSLSAEFRAASEGYGVPQELLLAMGYVNTRWEMPPLGVGGYEEASSGGRVRGPRQLRRPEPLLEPFPEHFGQGLGDHRAFGEGPEDAAHGERPRRCWRRPEPGEATDLNGWYDAVERYGGGAPYAA